MADQGLLEEALNSYEDILKARPDDNVAQNGKATVLRDLGRVDDAIAAYEQAIHDHPWDSVARCGKAEVARLTRDFGSALKEYKAVMQEFPHSPVAYSGYAETLRSMGKWSEAIDAFDKAKNRFPAEPRLAIGYALVHRDSGKFEQALQLFDQNIQKFPHDISSKLHRADLLKRLRRPSEAFRSYTDILNDFPDSQRARNAKAGLLILRRRFAEAEALLPEKSPRTEEEWNTYQVRGMLVLAQGRIRAAIKHFAQGAKFTPYARVRRRLHHAIALSNIRSSQFDEARAILFKENYAIEPSVAAKVLEYNVTVAQGRIARPQLVSSLMKEKLPAIRQLQKGIAAAYGVGNRFDRRPNKWINNRLFEVVLFEAA